MNYSLNRIIYLVVRGKFFSALREYRNAKKIKSAQKILPRKNIEELTDQTDPQMIQLDHADGNVSLEELRCIAKLVKYFEPKTLFEIGTFDGRTTMNMALNAPAADIYTLDLPKAEIHKTEHRIKKGDQTFINKEESGTRFSNTEQAKQITQIYADSASYDYSQLAGKVDFVFVDGAHTYEYVKSDTEAAFTLLGSTGGLIVWHDYEWKEVIQALNEYYQADPRFGDLINIQDTSLVVLRVS